MARVKTYPTRYTHRMRSVFPEPAQDAIADLGKALEGRGRTGTLLRQFRAAAAGMSAASIVQASEEVREIGLLYPETRIGFLDRLRGGRARGSGSHAAATRQERLFDALDGEPELGVFLMFHASGFVRERALRSLAEPPASPFEFAAILYRLNDWTEPVRRAALDYARRHFPATSRAVVADAYLFLAGPIEDFRRWGPLERQVVIDTVFGPEGLEALVGAITRTIRGPVPRAFDLLVRRMVLDNHLLTIATEAALPIVRARALSILLTRRVRTLIGYEHRRVPALGGGEMRVPQFSDRAIEHGHNDRMLLETGAADGSVAVRKLVGDALIARLDRPDAVTDAIAGELAADASPAVRERAAFYLRKRDGG